MKITVAIPTIAGRQEYLESCLKTCLSQNSADFEILVSDNSSGEAEEFIRSVRDPRLRYIRPERYLPMSAHWDFVMDQAAGDLITIIGDDDGLMPGCVEYVKEVHREFGNIPIHHSMCNYFWPDYPEKQHRNTVVFFHREGEGIEVVKSVDYLRSLCWGSRQYIDGPMVYHGFVPKELMKRLKRRGKYFCRAAPDVYSAVAVAANSKEYVSVQKYLTIFGQAAKANGASVRLNGNEGRRFQEETLKFYAPRFNSKTIQIMVVDSIIEVAEVFHQKWLLDEIDLVRHLTICIGEIGNMTNMQMQLGELSKVLTIAKSNKILAKVIQVASARVLERVRSRGLNALYSTIGSGRYLSAPPSRIKLDQNTFDIYTASLAVAQIQSIALEKCSE